jgi:hypothetical protein
MVGMDGVNLISSILYFDNEVGCLDTFESCFGEEYHVYTTTQFAVAQRRLAEHPTNINSYYPVKEIHILA